MKVRLAFGIILAIASLQIVSAQTMPDTMWLFKDIIADTEKSWFEIGLCDTSRANNDCFSPTDTGDKYDSTYINFDYQFSNAKPGYAGFKLFWDRSLATFNATTYDAMYFVHKGPLPGHKVHMVWVSAANCCACCGHANISCMDFGEFTPSTVWKKEVIAFPPNFQMTGLFELRFLIYNDSSITTSSTSAPGCLKLDNIAFIRKTAGVSKPTFRPFLFCPNHFFVPTVSGKVTLSVYSLHGERLFKGRINVAAGKKYNVNQFARDNSNLPARWIHCVQISGAGVKFTGKVCR